MNINNIGFYWDCDCESLLWKGSFECDAAALRVPLSLNSDGDDFILHKMKRWMWCSYFESSDVSATASNIRCGGDFILQRMKCWISHSLFKSFPCINFRRTNTFLAPNWWFCFSFVNLQMPYHCLKIGHLLTHRHHHQSLAGGECVVIFALSDNCTALYSVCSACMFLVCLSHKC